MNDITDQQAMDILTAVSEAVENNPALHGASNERISGFALEFIVNEVAKLNNEGSIFDPNLFELATLILSDCGISENNQPLYDRVLGRLINARLPILAPTEQQILDATEKAGLWPNTVRTWLPAFHRYHAELALMLNRGKPEQCTNSDTWNCKYCPQTKSCKALNDPRNYAGSVTPQPKSQDKTEQTANQVPEIPMNELRVSTYSPTVRSGFSLKADSGCRITHLATRIEVSAEDERSIHKAKSAAMVKFEQAWKEYWSRPQFDSIQTVSMLERELRIARNLLEKFRTRLGDSKPQIGDRVLSGETDFFLENCKPDNEPVDNKCQTCCGSGYAPPNTDFFICPTCDGKGTPSVQVEPKECVQCGALRHTPTIGTLQPKQKFCDENYSYDGLQADLEASGNAGLTESEVQEPFHEMLEAILSACERVAMPVTHLAIINDAGMKFINAIPQTKGGETK